MAHVVLLALTECGLLAADSGNAGGVLIVTGTMREGKLLSLCYQVFAGRSHTVLIGDCLRVQ